MHRIKVILSKIAVIVLFVVICGCGSQSRKGEDTRPADEDSAASLEIAGSANEGSPVSLDVIYPLDGSIFPPDFVAPTFLWRDKDSKANYWAIDISGKNGSEPLRFHSEGDPPPQGEIDKRCIAKTNEIYVPYAVDGPVHSWTPDAETWKRIQKQCGQSGATITIMGLRKDQQQQPLSTGQISISLSKDLVGAPIFYRDVPLMPAKNTSGVIQPLPKNALGFISWRLRDLTKPESRIVMKEMPSCANCHTFSADGKMLGMDIDGPTGDKGAYSLAPVKEKMVIEDKDVITWNSFKDKPKGHKTIGFMSQVSPDGQYAVTTVNEAVFIKNFTDYKFLQVFYPTRGILAYYSRKTGQMKALPGADNPLYVQCDPTWSPDGKYLIFARAKAKDHYYVGGVKPKYANDPNEVQIQYDLYRIPFNDGRGGKPEPVVGASQNGMSNTFPKISPDGRWVVWVKCRNGQLMRPDSRLWMVSTAGGEAREMHCNTPLMNSWHSFSPNGRWMVFSSKCNTPYTQMFLTHIDEQGQDSPAILIPNSTAANRAVNLPEFANIKYDELVSIDVPVVDWRRLLNRGKDLLEEGKPRSAVEKLKGSLHLEPQQADAHLYMGQALTELKLLDQAIEQFRKALEINPKLPDAHCNLGSLLHQKWKYDEAIEHYIKAIELDSEYGPAHVSLGTVLAQQKKFDQAIKHFTKALEIDPNVATTHYNLGNALFQLGKFDQAIEHFSKTLEIDPQIALAHYKISSALTQQGKYEQAVSHLRKAIQINPNNIAVVNDLAWLLATCPEDGVRDGARAVGLAEKLSQATGHKVVALLDTLAAAYAEAGKFPQAVDTATKALNLVKPEQKALAERIRLRLEQYKAGKPYRQQL
ncbi:MAG: tetratricopeptide repeat protein [Pirellulales bacterium]|nr:tetratricopeptide repeat protein [Pirellulales bacterium]